MTEQRMHIVKMIVAVLLILATPTLFFQFVGDNPMEITENATRSIAVVNEDIGSVQVFADNDEEELTQFGQEVTYIFEDESDYEWTVMGRSAADNGLNSQKYDAVIYIPSDFSENILTYDQQQPEKANFQYKVQGQLNSANREKVLRELEDAANRVDQEMSSLYWSYVSTDLETVRQEFDRILENEVNFQNAMLSFYQPSSQNLAGEIEQQKQMLESLRSTMQQGEEGSTTRQNTLEMFEQNLTEFIQYVESYQEYQDRQRELLKEAQDESILTIKSGTEEFLNMQRESIQAFNDQGQQIEMGIQDFQALLNKNGQTLADLSVVRLEQVDRQEEELKAVHAGFIDLYEQEENKRDLTSLQSSLASLKSSISSGEDDVDEDLEKVEPETAEEPGEDGDNISAPEDLDPNSMSLEEERAQLILISDEIVALKDTLTTQLAEEPSPEVQATLEQLIEVSNEIKATEQAILTKEDQNAWKVEYGSLFTLFDSLLTKHNELLEINKQDKSQIADLLVKNNDLVTKHNNLVDMITSLRENLSKDKTDFLGNIENKEQEILDSEALTSSRKEELQVIFEPEIVYNTENLSKIMDYYGKLSEVDSILNEILSIQEKGNLTRDFVMDDSFLNDDIKTILSLTEEEQNAWEVIMNEEVPATQEELKVIEKSFMTFIEQYNSDIDSLQTATAEDLDAMQQSATTVLSQIQDPANSTGVESPRPNVEDATLMNNQENVAQELLLLNDLVSSVGENQDNVVTFTGELQQQVNNVQEDADTLNEKWATTVASTKLVREDVFSVLGNAFVDGQNNDMVYNHLANPLQISGDAPAEAAKKIPPVVILVIILLSSLLIGFFSHYFSNAPLLVRGSLFGLLNLIVGLIISLFGLNIYNLSDERAIQWSIFTILLLLLGSTVVRVAFFFGNMIGWVASVGLVAFFVSPLLAQTTPNFNYEDPMSRVYLSLQYDTNSLFTQGVTFAVTLIVILTALPFLAKTFKNTGMKKDRDEVHEI
ncbi:type VII secretion protein EsaA [Metabacillus herbersteinensis]|uniref:Type VII secretion protein EsaA n=1 Tax=Metabacillus herbersteinensis TaxID=283816 RepID=A0ABV6GHE3_9BACI